MALPAWLPPLEPFNGDWGDTEQRNAYLDHIYQLFEADFVDSVTVWRGKRVAVRFQPAVDGRGNTFSHAMTEGVGASRSHAPRRYERVRWLKAVLSAPEDDVRTWEQFGREGPRLAIGIPDFSYVVFVQPYPERVQLITAYDVAPWRRKKYEREWTAEKR